ncbi:MULTISPECIES: cytochrome c5 family protein [unclassified Oceanobacter]|uniref:c-type cytochrome n=1 Tax=unclassified Oceanobacter TaxID=2620260 RepID=UPI0026E15FE9|nr:MULTISPECIES: c-type cytochrome [unclassified Oceanobacter]MDO6682141.1 c-type cytochrome [Oceanobacter sp. 5_MG-2023]MDP2505463.1 c-type cytochrome [Oceanobacter sp. 3_MG-2023]MDP2548608.1 c-type cytochrome [Oceanobacter sp. 4_MG-2023]MDP2610371.1 c-type cytochrome [Oceanobacter sp. 1_MG-2023]MDP2613619.1 c-type cytochrome [Oceanobacter sp. 2_MG-2023]
MKHLKALILVAATLLVSQAFAATATNEENIRERIAPVGDVCVGAECGGAVVVASGPRSGEDIYGAACIACHGSGILGAPKKGDTAAWNTRLDKGFEATLSNAVNGLNAMPPKGNCLDCSEDELLAAIKFMSGHE